MSTGKLELSSYPLYLTCLGAHSLGDRHRWLLEPLQLNPSRGPDQGFSLPQDPERKLFRVGFQCQAEVPVHHQNRGMVMMFNKVCCRALTSTRSPMSLGSRALTPRRISTWSWDSTSHSRYSRQGHSPWLKRSLTLFIWRSWTMLLTYLISGMFAS